LVKKEVNKEIEFNQTEAEFVVIIPRRK